MKRGSWKLLVAVSGMAFTGCSSSPLDTQEALELRQEVRSPRTLHVNLTFPGDPLYGERSEWEASIREVFEDLKVCADVGFDHDPRQADAEVALSLEDLRTSGQWEKTRIVAGGAVLDFLAWGWVPFLPLWVDDVEVVPETRMHVSVHLHGVDRKAVSDSWCPPLETCHRERFPFLSWKTLGAILVPPFVFQDPDPEHFAESVAEDVRLQLACAVATQVKRATRLGADEDLLYRLELRPREGENGHWVLEYEPDYRLLQEMTFEVVALKDPDRSPVMFRSAQHIPFHAESRPRDENDRFLRRQFPLGEIEGHEDRLLRIRARGRDGRTMSYSLRFEESRPPETGEFVPEGVGS